MQNGALSRSNSVQTILKALRKDIIFYRYQDGQQVREIELAQEYGVSWAAVRGALMILEKEGLIIANPNGTRNIACLSEKDLSEFHDLRAHLETVAVEQVAAGDKDMEGIFEVVNKIRMLDEGASQSDIQKLDSAFHGSIIRASGNKAVIGAWTNIEQVMCEIAWPDLPGADNTNVEHFKKRHLDLFMTLMQGPETAVAEYKAHLASSRDKSLNNYGNFVRYTRQQAGR